jgi:type II secretion system protein H
MKKASGFTLVELTVVLLIMGIVAAAVTLKMSGPVSRVKLQDVVKQVKQFDTLTRSYTRQQGKAVRVNVDLSENRISRLDDEGEPLGRPLQLPSNFKIEKCLIASQQDASDMALLKYNSQGMTHSYAIKLADKLQSKWIIIIGLTGQVVELKNEQEVQEILESLSRDDAG